MANKQIIGWDFGGAHIKAALLDEQARLKEVIQVPCPLWQGLGQLEDGIDQILEKFGLPTGQNSITMTGELVDLFSSREEGVRRILEVVKTKLPAKTLFVFAGRTGLIRIESTVAEYEKIASANWLATARFLSKKLAQGLLVDIGSTTTDIVVFRDGEVVASGHSDHERLITDELVYTGVVRTPLVALAQRVPFRGLSVGLMAEQFATMADIYRLTGELSEDADQSPASDGRPKTPEDSARRLARMLGKDLIPDEMKEWVTVAKWAREQQLNRIQAACERVLAAGGLDPEAPLVGAGVGHFLVERLAKRLGRQYRDFSDLVEAAEENKIWATYCAPAYAVAALCLLQYGL